MCMLLKGHVCECVCKVSACNNLHLTFCGYFLLTPNYASPRVNLPFVVDGVSTYPTFSLNENSQVFIFTTDSKQGRHGYLCAAQ